MEGRYAASQEAGEDSKPGGPDRLAKGLRTPESAFVRPILQALEALGGRGQMAQVLELVGEEMQGQFREVDHQPLKSDPGGLRWNNTAQWARKTMVDEGLLKKDSP